MNPGSERTPRLLSGRTCLPAGREFPTPPPEADQTDRAGLFNVLKPTGASHRGALHAIACVVSVLLGLLFGPTDEALSQTVEKSIGIRIGGAVFPAYGRFDPQVEMGGSPVLGFFAGIRQSRYSLEMSLDWIRTDFQRLIKTTVSVPGGPSRTTYEQVNGELYTIPIQLTGRLHLFEAGGVVDPYLDVGGGYYFNIFHQTGSQWKNSTTTQKADVNIDDTFGAQVGLGTNIRVSPVLAITIDGQYVLARAAVSYKSHVVGAPSSAKDTLHFNGFVGTVGVKYIFPE
jgi:OmpW family